MSATSRNVDTELHQLLQRSCTSLISLTPPEDQRPMSDRYQGFVSSPIGKLLVKNLGLPSPTRLERYADGAPLVKGTVVLGGQGRLSAQLPTVLDGLGIASTTTKADDELYKGLVFDAT